MIFDDRETVITNGEREEQEEQKESAKDQERIIVEIDNFELGLGFMNRCSNNHPIYERVI